MNGPFPEDQQFALSKTLATLVGFDFEHGRLDKTAHLFMSGILGDIRITTRYRTLKLTTRTPGLRPDRKSHSRVPGQTSILTGKSGGGGGCYISGRDGGL
jgi:hypothetical protein